MIWHSHRETGGSASPESLALDTECKSSVEKPSVALVAHLYFRASMVGVAQLVELRLVMPAVVGSSPIVHPIFYSFVTARLLQMQFRFSRQCLSVLLQDLGSSSQPFTMALASSARFFFVSMASLDPTFLQRAPTTQSAGLVSPDMGMRSFRKKSMCQTGF